MSRTADATRAPSVRTHTGHQMPVGAGRYFQRPHGEGRGQSMETRVIADASPVASAHSTKRPRQARPRWSAARRLIPYLFVLPFVLLFAAFFVAPLVYAFSQSLYTVRSSGLGFGPRQVIWAGAANYLKALHDPQFWDGFGRVLLFGAVQIPVMMTIALVMAMLMDSAVIRFRRFFRLAFFVPYAVPIVIAAILWGFFYSPTSTPIVQGFSPLQLRRGECRDPRPRNRPRHVRVLARRAPTVGSLTMANVPLTAEVQRTRGDDRARPVGLRPFGLRNLAAYVLLIALTVYCLTPLYWLVVAATKDNTDLFSSFGLWFAHVNLWQNLADTFTHSNGAYPRWLLNTSIYPGVGSFFSMLLSVLCAYALAQFSLP